LQLPVSVVARFEVFIQVIPKIRRTSAGREPALSEAEGDLARTSSERTLAPRKILRKLRMTFFDLISN
jgi:hypothetical protein